MNEDPWERLRTIRKMCPNTKLQMLFRGQNIAGLSSLCRRRAGVLCTALRCQLGIDIIRIFDALNDIKNLEVAIKAAKKEGAHAQVAISYTTGPGLYQ